jgi:hypothetical protein
MGKPKVKPNMLPPAYTAFSVSQICSVPLANFSSITFLGI